MYMLRLHNVDHPCPIRSLVMGTVTPSLHLHLPTSNYPLRLIHPTDLVYHTGKYQVRSMDTTPIRNNIILPLNRHLRRIMGSIPFRVGVFQKQVHPRAAVVIRQRIQETVMVPISPLETTTTEIIIIMVGVAHLLLVLRGATVLA
jgi:hypothetical protein